VFFPKKAVLGFEAGQKKSATAMPGAGHCHRQGADRCPERCRFRLGSFRADLVPNPGLAGADADGGHPFHGSGQLHHQHLAARTGAADLAGASAALGAVTQFGPLVTMLIIAGARSTAMCADLGSRTIGEEIDAMEVLGINPVQRLGTPRMLASGLVALLLSSAVPTLQ
jgi:hypothetical protein